MVLGVDICSHVCYVVTMKNTATTAIGYFLGAAATIGVAGLALAALCTVVMFGALAKILGTVLSLPRMSSKAVATTTPAPKALNSSDVVDIWATPVQRPLAQLTA